MGSRCVETGGKGFPSKVLSGGTIGPGEETEASGGGSCKLSGEGSCDEDGASSGVRLPGSLCVRVEATLTNAGISPTCRPGVIQILAEETVTQ